MLDFFIAKMISTALLSPRDCELLVGICAGVRGVRARTQIVTEGDRAQSLLLLERGMACSFKAVASGCRQITSFIFPGDFCDLRCTSSHVSDYSVETLTEAVVAEFPIDKICQLARKNERIGQALWRAKLMDEALLRAWLVNLGQKDADERMAHLLCEMYFRMKQIGLTSGTGFQLPVTRAEIADVLGLSAVHVSRTIQKLRQQGLIALHRKSIKIRNLRKLMIRAEFDPP